MNNEVIGFIILLLVPWIAAAIYFWNLYQKDEEQTYDYQRRELDKRFIELKQSVSESFLPVFKELLDKINEAGKEL